MKPTLFDTWTDKYDSWFTTPIGGRVLYYERALLLDLLAPEPSDLILDAGCGTGIFTKEVTRQGSAVIGIDLSAPMVSRGVHKLNASTFTGLCADMCSLPFKDSTFDKAFSMTALEFLPDAVRAIAELERVVKNGGCIVVTTLNSLSPWAEQRLQKAQHGHSLFDKVTFRSPDDMRQLISKKCHVQTAIHFLKDTRLEDIADIEQAGMDSHLETGAFLAAQWVNT